MRKDKRLLLFGTILFALCLSFLIPVCAVGDAQNAMCNAIINGDANDVKNLHDRGVNFPDNWYSYWMNYFRRVCRDDAYEFLVFLVNNGAKITFPFNYNYPGGSPPNDSESVIILWFLFNCPEFPFDRFDEDIKQQILTDALIYCVNFANFKYIKKLISYGTRVDVLGTFGRSAIQQAEYCANFFNDVQTEHSILINKQNRYEIYAKIWGYLQRQQFKQQYQSQDLKQNNCCCIIC